MSEGSKEQLLSESVAYGSRKIDFQVRRTARKTLAIEVHPDSSVQLIAPNGSSLEELKQKVVKRGKWIVKQQAYFETFLPTTPKREYVSGETHFYLGRRYLLKVQQGNENSVKLRGGKIEVVVKSLQQEKTKEVLAAWYYRHAKKKFEETMELAVKKFGNEQIGVPPMEIKRMQKRWGSCTSDGKIILNPELIKASPKCIEYVVTHELCHLEVLSHNKEFYRLLEDKMPEWQRWKERLEKLMA